MFQRENGNGKCFLKGLLIGGVVGAIAALFLAPKEGKKMRNDLCKCCKDVSHKTKDVVCDVCDKAEDLMERAKEIAEEAKEIASSITKGWKK